MHLIAATNLAQPDDLETTVGDSDSYHGNLVAFLSKEEVTPIL